MHHFIAIRAKSTLALFLIVLSMSCMDPVIEPEDQYSDYVGGVAAKSLNDPEQGFPNGSFEEDLKYWGGWEGGETGYVTVRTHSPNDSSMAAHGDKSLKITAQNGGAGIYSYFSYNPGDTLVYTFSYMIPTAVEIVEGNPAFNLQVGTRPTNENDSFLDDFTITYFSCDSTGDNQLIADGEWHEATVKFANKSLETAGTYFQFWFWEWSVWNWFAPERELIAYVDNFRVDIKQSSDPKPTDFSILHPSSGDVFNLDTIVGFQTIPFSWEAATDNDTVVYTNKLVTRVPCDGALISDGFESYEVLTRIDPATGLPSNYKMPDGFGTFASNWFYGQSNGESEFTIWVSDTASRTGSHSLRMGASSLETSAHYTTMLYRLSQVDFNWNKDRITPGTIITVNGYMMTPEDSKIEGNNTGSVVLAAVDDTWNYATSPVVNADKVPGEWYPFEVSMTIPERREYPNTTTVFLGFRFSQFNGEGGEVYFDDITLSSSRPLTYFVTDYYEVITPQTNTMMSAAYLRGLFSFVKNDLNGIQFSQVDFEWSILATDFYQEVHALNSPLNFTVIDTSNYANQMITGTELNEPFDLNSFNELLLNNE